MAGKSNKAALAAKAAAAAKKKAQKEASNADSANAADAVVEDEDAPQRSVTGVLASRPTSRDLKIDNFSLGLNGIELIQDCSIELTIGRRYGLLGQNGCGKTNFLDCLAKREVPIPAHMDMYHLREEAKPSDRTALESVVDHIREEIKKLEELEEQIMTEVGPDDERLEGIYERLDSLDPATFESRAAELLHGLGFGPAMMKKATKDMSGGWRMRVALARALFAEPTILLLDEPTNHLDLEACVWLEGFLREYKKCLVIISHSQDFLNGVCTHIIWLTQNKLTYYTGNYDTFCKTVKENNVLQTKKYEKEQEDIKHLKAFIASCGTYANLVKQAKSKQKILDKMEADGLTKPVHVERTLHFKFPACEKLPPPVLPFVNVAFSYSGKKEDHLYEDMNLAIDCDSRVALVGPNGAGKSTLLKLILGQITPTVGVVQKHSHLSIQHYHQHSTEVLDQKATVIDYFQAQFPNSMTFQRDLEGWRAFLGRYGVSGRMQTTKIGCLSEGQQSRIVFATMCMSNPNLLLLDEPTNHLDIEAIDSLAEALTAYNGGLVLVSHDFRLIEQVVKEIWVCDKKQVKPWDGDIRSYKKMLIKKCGYKAGEKPATVSK